MTALSRRARLLLAVAVVSFAGVAAAYLLAPPHTPTRALVAALSSTWTGLYALVCGVIAARGLRDRNQRSAWWWIAAGCAVYLAGELIQLTYDLTGTGRPPFPPLADASSIGMYPCLLVAVTRVVRTQPRRRLDPELVLDTVLVTLVVGSLAYEWLLQPIFAAGGGTLALVASVAWSIGAVAVLWLMLLEMMRHTRFPVPAPGLVTAGVALLCVANGAYAVAALGGGSFVAGGPLDLGQDVAFLAIGAAGALAPERAGAAAVGRAAGISGEVGRLAAVIVGLAGVLALGVGAALSPDPDALGAVVLAASVAIIAARFVSSIRADRRYAELLENEVASQTRSLMASLSATAAAERSLRLVMDAVPDAVVVLDRDGRVLDGNEPGRAMLGKHTVFDVLEGGAAAVVRQRLATAFQGEVQRFEVPFERADGTRGLRSVLYAPVREGAQVASVLALMRDVTDQKRTEAQLQQAEKLTAMGQLVSGVAHEINNPAAIISGFAQTLLLDELKPEHREMLQMIYDEATRIGRITSNLLAFARAGSKQRTLVDLNDIARRTFALRSYHLSTLNIAVSLELSPEDPKIWADASELQQMLLNLLINAEQALVSVNGPRNIVVRTSATDDEVTLVVSDSGPGIPPEIRSKVFDPFFTTKPEGVGTGLGLSICYGIAQEHGGRISVESPPAGGASFRFALPRDPRAEGRAAVAAPAAAPAAAGTVTVLVVDDETALRNALLRFLGRRGIQGQGVADGAAALRALRQRPFDVIISDVRMPGMSGREFLEQLRRDHPEMLPRLVFSTGDTFAPDTAELVKESGVPTVTKPFDFATLEEVVRRVAAEAEGLG